MSTECTEKQEELKDRWLRQLETDLAGVGRGRPREDWDIYFKGLFIQPLLAEQDGEYIEFFEHARVLVEQSGNANWAKRQYLEHVETKWLTEENMRIYLGQIELHALYELDVWLKTPEGFADVYERLVPDPVADKVG